MKEVRFFLEAEEKIAYYLQKKILLQSNFCNSEMLLLTKQI